MTSKHTPGPWDITWGPSIEIGDGVASVPIRFDGKHTANAMLIAAAPDLLAAAETAIYEMRHTVAPRNSFTEAVDLLDAAISKARGE